MKQDPARTHTAKEIMKIVQRGVAGHLTLVAAQAGWDMSSELALYPAIGAVFSARGWVASCQFRNKGTVNNRGAPKAIDFVARPREANAWNLAIEIKLIASRGNLRTLNVMDDLEKLRVFTENYAGSSAYLLIAGRKSDINKTKVRIGDELINLSAEKQVIADLGPTAWGSVIIKTQLD